jgi:hypothetical protein
MYISNNKTRKVVCVMIQHITGILRNQLFFSSLQDIILPENPARLSMFCRINIITNFSFSVQTIKRKVA